MAFVCRAFRPVAITKKSVKSHTPRISRIVTSVASFSWQRAAVRRACSSGVSAVSRPLVLVLGLSLLGARVQTQARDRVGDLRRDETVDRLSQTHAFAYARGRDRHGRHLEGHDPVRRRQPLAGVADALVGYSRPHCDGEANEVEDSLRA